MTIFQRLLDISNFERTNLSYLSDIDRWLIIHIGATVEAGESLSLKQLYLCEIAPKATVRRRLSRLIALELIEECSDFQDLRTVQLRVTPKGFALLLDYEDFWCDHCRQTGR